MSSDIFNVSASGDGINETVFAFEQNSTLAQYFEGRTYYYAPSSSGWIRPGSLLDWRFDPALFPDLRSAAVVGVVKVESFRMRFPVARIEAGD